MQNCTANLDPDHACIGRPSSIRQGFDYQRHECRCHIDRHNQFPFARQTAPFRKVTGNQPILRRNIADPRARLKTLRHNPRLELIRPTSPPRRAIKNLNPRHSLRPAHLHPVLVLVLHSQSPAKSVAGRHARSQIRPKPRGWRTAYTASILRSRWTPTDTSRENLHTGPHRSLRIHQEGGVRTPLTLDDLLSWNFTPSR